jgi:hypothetical protein
MNQGISRRNRKRLALTCLAAWLFAVTVGVGYACGVLPLHVTHSSGISHALQPAEGTASSHGNDGSCGTFCAGDLPLVAKLQSVQGWSGVQVFILDTRLDGLSVLVGAGVETPSGWAVSTSSVPPRLRYLRLTL